ncbi:MAG: 2-amino-4-hydroxy-6-hydroxymethyldihydropteridine diphosphokinase [Litorilituus sp.]|nr:2-amino-4-hydroxy-6-hydroxymethyldihydropteridine diphosphokinase [Litorilituus sp.]
MHRVYVSLGSNINRCQHISAALDVLDRYFSPLIISNFYDCQPIGFDGDNFLNLVVGFDCADSIATLSEKLKVIEDDNGRIRTGPKFSSRTLDIDILTYDSVVGCVEGVILPRKEITENAFVLLPMSEVAAKAIHPVLKKTYQALWQQYNQQSQKLSLIDFTWRSKKY